MLRAAVIASAIAVGAATEYADIAGYVPGTDVVEHSEIDLDQQAIETAVGDNDWTTASSVYTDGQNSAKSSGMRTIKGMSKDLSGEYEYDKFLAYYGDATYGDMWVQGALGTTNVDFTTNGDADFATVSDDKTRQQAIKKGTTYMIIWMYAIHELESAIGSCAYDSTDTNNGAVHYLDEAVAFYAGSLTSGGASDGVLQYKLAQSRAGDFNTKDADGIAEVNNEVFEDFNLFKSKLEGGNCAGLRGITERITAQGYVPIIQGVLKYAYTVSTKEQSSGLANSDMRKYQAEAATFAAALLGRLSFCSSTAAATVHTNLKVGAAFGDVDFDAVKTAIEGQYLCMNITCADVGGRYDDDAYVWDACTDTYADIAGYSPPTNVIAHNMIDLDQDEMEGYLAADTVDYAAAKAIYSTGGNSARRTIQGFSKDLTGEVEFDKAVAFYGDNTYADKWVSGALDGTAVSFTNGKSVDFTPAADSITDDTRVQATKKGTVQMNIWIYALHELEAAITKCDSASTDQNTAAVHALDEGVAFYTGTLAGADGSGGGVLMYKLAQSRCSDFGTCATSGTAKSTEAIFAAFEEFKTDLQGNDCSTGRAHTDTVGNMGFIQIIQGTLKYAWKCGVDGAHDDPKYKAEAATFAAALSGHLNSCSATDADLVWTELVANMGDTTYVPDFAAVKAALESNYECMGLTCDDIGKYQDDWVCDTSGSAASTGGGGGGGGGTTTIIIIAAAAVVAILVAVVAYKVLCKAKAPKTAAPGPESA